jgi:hypothetical protein
MRVAIDATPLTLSSGGLRRYTQELSVALAENFPQDEFILVSGVWTANCINWKLNCSTVQTSRCPMDRLSRSLVDCLNNIRFLEEHGIRFIAVTQGLHTAIQNPASRFLLHVLGAAAEFERSPVRERTQAGRLRYKQDFECGQDRQNRLQQIQEKPAHRSPQAHLPPGAGDRTPPRRGPASGRSPNSLA